jgi:hypothetical protein
MENSLALLAALRAKAALGSDILDAEQVEALGHVLGLTPTELPSLVTSLADGKHVELVWKGGLKVLPEAKASNAGASVSINMPNAKFGKGAAIAGIGNATGGAITRTPEIAQGELAAVLVQLREMLPKLTGEAANAASKVEETLEQAPAASASPDDRRSWAQTAALWINNLVRLAPEMGELAKVGEEAVKALT